jgi:hypothetical protein
MPSHNAKSPTFIDALGTYLDAREVYKQETALGTYSKYWDDTYGFGQSIVYENYRRAKIALKGALDGAICFGQDCSEVK